MADAAPELIEHAARALRAYGQDLRSDWSDFDGRSARGALTALAEAMESGDVEQVAGLADQWADDLAETEDRCGIGHSNVGRQVCPSCGCRFRRTQDVADHSCAAGQADRG